MSASSSPEGCTSPTRMEAATEIGLGETYVIGQGHDAWVVGDETFVGFEFESRPFRGVRTG
jgi:hypothetical protein